MILAKFTMFLGGLVVVFYFGAILYFSSRCPRWSDPIGEWGMWLALVGISCLCVLGGVALMGSCLDSMGWW